MRYINILLFSFLILSNSRFSYGDTSCYSTTKRFYNDCSDSSGFYPPKEARFIRVGERDLMLVNSNFKVMVFDLSASVDNPPIIGDMIMPFPEGCGLPFGCGESHFQYMDTLWPVSASASGNTGYAFVPLNNYGWDLLRITTDGSNVSLDWFNTGYHPPEGNGAPYHYGRLLFDSSYFYLISQMLDIASVNGSDESIKIYNLGSNPPSDLYNSIGSGTRIPIGKPEDGEFFASAQLSVGKHRFFVRDTGIKRILMVYTAQLYPASSNYIAFFDITNPDKPLQSGFITYSSDPSLFSVGLSAVTFESDKNRFWVASVSGGSPATVTIKGYNLTENNGAVNLIRVSSGSWDIGSQSGAGIPYLSAGYGLLVFGWMQAGKAFSIQDSGELIPLPDEPGYTDLSINIEEPCQYWELARGYTGLGVFKAGDEVYFYRGAMKEGRMIKVSSDCLYSSPYDEDMETISDYGSEDAEEISDFEEESGFPDVTSDDVIMHDFNDSVEIQNNGNGCSCNIIE